VQGQPTAHRSRRAGHGNRLGPRFDGQVADPDVLRENPRNLGQQVPITDRVVAKTLDHLDFRLELGDVGLELIDLRNALLDLRDLGLDRSDFALLLLDVVLELGPVDDKAHRADDDDHQQESHHGIEGESLAFGRQQVDLDGHGTSS